MADSKSCGKGKCFFKGLLAIVIFAVIAMAIGDYFWGTMYKDIWMAEEYSALWRPESAEEWKLMPYAYALYSFIFVAGYCKFACGMKCPMGTRFGGGAMYGIFIWLFTGVMCSFWMYIVHPVSTELAMIGAKEVLATNIIGGGVTALILGNKSDS